MFKQLRELTKLTKTDCGLSKFVQTSSDYFDYGVGFLEVILAVYKSTEDEVGVCLLLATIDDGGYVARRVVKDKLEAHTLINNIAENLIKEMVVLPSLEQFNTLLRPYGLFLHSEG
jgi:hypothetical protein